MDAIDPYDLSAKARCSILFGQWMLRPHEHLRTYKNGTLFLLRSRTGKIHLCELFGNLPTDESWKARRLSDGKILRLENQHRAECLVLTPGSRQ